MQVRSLSWYALPAMGLSPTQSRNHVRRARMLNDFLEA